jgi:putative transcriptional regulator
LKNSNWYLYAYHLRKFIMLVFPYSPQDWVVERAMGKKAYVKIYDLMDKTGLSLREIGRRADIGHSALSAMGQEKREYVYLEHLNRIADTFDISDMREILDFKETDDD